MAYLLTAASLQYFIGTSAPVTAGPLSMAAWFRPRVTVAGNQTIACLGASTNSSQVRLAVNASGAAAWKFDTAGSFVTATSAGSVAAGGWIHIACTLEASGNITAYHNGVAGTPVAAPGAMTLDRMIVGARMTSGALSIHADGDVAEVGVYNAILTADEIAALAKGYKCSDIRPQSLRFDLRMIRDLQDRRGGMVMTNTNGASVSSHPRIIYP